MKHLYLTLTFLLPLFGGTVFAQTGMTVFGDCYVSDSASIGFFGDELTLQSDVKGEGSLVMAGDKPQMLTARNGTIDRLVIANPTVVTLKGKLTVRKPVIILQGTLNVLPQGQLYVNPSAMFSLAESCQIVHAGIALQQSDTKMPLTKQSLGWSESLATGNLQIGSLFSFNAQVAQLSTLSALYHSPFLPALASPP